MLHAEIQTRGFKGKLKEGTETLPPRHAAHPV